MNLAKLRNEILDVAEQYHNKITMKCYQLKFHRSMDGDFENAFEISTKAKLYNQV